MATASGLDATLMKEEQRIAMKRAANEERRLRFLNARKRVMGIDVAALNAQVAEKAALAEAEKEADRYERVRQMEIDMILEQTTEEERLTLCNGTGAALCHRPHRAEGPGPARRLQATPA